MGKKSVSKKEKKITKKEEKKISEIEKEVGQAEKEIKEERAEKTEKRISEFLTLNNVKAPVLERIASQQRTENQAETEQQNRTRREGKIDYSASNEPKYGAVRIKKEEKKYETSFVPPVLTRNEPIGRRQEFLRPTETSTWDRQNSQGSQFIETGTIAHGRLPFEGEQKKYKKVRF